MPPARCRSRRRTSPRSRTATTSPALIEGMKQQRAEIDAIAANPAAPTFDNTIVAMEKSGRMLDRVSQTFFGVQSRPTPTTRWTRCRADERRCWRRIRTRSSSNPKLFARVKALYDKRASAEAGPGSAAAAEVYYSQFVHAGANLSDAGQDAAAGDQQGRRQRWRPSSSRSWSPPPRPARWWWTTRPSWPASADAEIANAAARRQGAQAWTANMSSRCRTPRSSRR